MQFKLGALLACLTMAFVAPACGVQQSNDDQSESAQSELKTDEVATNTTCNGFEPGLQVPGRKLAQFEACLTTCVNGPLHPSWADCKDTCCFQYTGCHQCYEQ